MSVFGTMGIAGDGARDITIRLGKSTSINVDTYASTLSIKAISLISTSLGTIKIV